MNLGSLDVEKNRRLKIPKHLGLVECWGLINPIIAREIGGGVYTPVPYLTETSAYKISNIFVRDRSTVNLFWMDSAIACVSRFQFAYSDRLLRSRAKVVQSYRTREQIHHVKRLACTSATNHQDDARFFGLQGEISVSGTNLAHKNICRSG